MSTKPKYISDLETQVALIQQAQSDLRRDRDADGAIQQEILKSVTEIKICLKGTEFDNESGGLVKQVKTHSDCLEQIKKTQARREGVIGVASAFIGGLIMALGNFLWHKLSGGN